MRFAFILVLAMVPLIGQEPVAVDFPQIDKTKYQENPLLELKSRLGKAKSQWAVIATSVKGVPYVNIMKINEIDERGLESMSTDKSEKYLQLRENGSVAVLIRWKGDDDQFYVAKVMGQADLSQPKITEREVTINGEREHLKWMSYRVVPQKVIFSEYSPSAPGFGGVVSIVYTKTPEGLWQRTPEKKPFIMLQNGEKFDK